MAESMTGMKRTCRCAELSEANIGQTVTVMGWVQKQRNKGGIVFVDLRDRSGLIQLIYEEADCGTEAFEKADSGRTRFGIFYGTLLGIGLYIGLFMFLPFLVEWQVTPLWPGQVLIVFLITLLPCLLKIFPIF